MKLINKIVECVLCGQTSDQSAVVGSSILDSMDLDTRPSETRRSALPYYVQECPYCHYCNPDISKREEGITRSSIEADNYVKLLKNSSINTDARKFILASYLYTSVNDIRNAALNYLYAAWMFDDLKEIENAIKARKKTATLLEKYLDETKDMNFTVILLDVYRRSNDFEKCIVFANELLSKGVANRFLDDVVKYEVSLAEKKDNTCHKVSECLEG